MAELRDWPRVLRRNPPRILLRYWPRNPPRVLLRVPAEDPTEESPRVSVWSRRRPGPVDAATRRCSGSLLQPPLSAPPCFFRCKSSGGFPARISGILFFRVRDGAAGMRRGGRAERGRGTAGSLVLLNLPDPLPEGFLGRSVRGSSLLYPRSSERSLQRRKSGKCRKKVTGAPPCPLPDCPSSFPAAGSVPSTGSAREVRPEEDAAPRGEPLLRGKGRVTPKSQLNSPLSEPARLFQHLFGAFDSNYRKNSAF